jgi:hypothetical protein
MACSAASESPLSRREAVRLVAWREEVQCAVGRPAQTIRVSGFSRPEPKTDEPFLGLALDRRNVTNLTPMPTSRRLPSAWGNGSFPNLPAAVGLPGLNAQPGPV